ncbi:translation initiation factor IF-2 [Rhodanobacter denitrificans]|uniref:Translation initiation factor IF-2 n=1 Tax=Rhodanobacter denitrificans TaxID=666685 RepID=I4WLT2_9GAMM|nr:translation initiation factor IF-2 [Rhodanobacter denitrificans]AGG88621.1 bacterial translation initiation factor 2 (bIF-2) [Rhodanobacter denitrificans]EIM00424.1 translation initiation factor IF-2 [Rhodanobacter denitrificans]UJJ58713.1 translation initiation factor IF-2 [Rhodanobacter denitrificans]UJM87755.1 translation initiation factor IF-2 [Rhodanobacter denitrificans]UJM89173.1 translation initiation factor IF-2 [Rhodanobacter denitrificans]
MSDVTIKQLAQVLGMPVDKLLTQLGEAGMKFSDQEQVISSTEKVKLLGFLRRTHGKSEAAAEVDDSAPRQITLKRRTVGELKVAAPGGRGATGAAKTVNVEVRAKRTYVKRSVIAEEASAEPEREDAVRKLQESQQQREQEERERTEAEQRRQAEAQHALDEQRRRAEKEQHEVEPAGPVEPAVVEHVEATPEPAAEAAPVAAGDDAAAAVQRIDQRDLGMILPRIHEPRKREKPVKPAAAPAAPVAPAARAVVAGGAVASTAAGDAGRGKPKHPRERNDSVGSKEDRDAGKRFAGGQMHLSEADRARRSSSSKRGKPGRSGGREPLRGGGAGPTGPHGFSRPTAPVVREVVVGDTNVVAELAQKMAVKGSEVVKALFKMGVMATINQTVDHDTAVLVVEELGHTPVADNQNNAEETLAAHTQTIELEGEKVSRPPVVTIMGHVDHGKTSLLDYIRRTKVASGEAGGITQHIGAYHVQTSKGVITFLDTPGHAAFTSMRARGAQSTDIVILVVAADDGVKPQTIEAVKHARAAKVPLIVAVNKMDKDGANPDNVKQGLVAQEVVPEDWGGDVQFVPVSAKTGMGVEDLLDAISVQAEVMELKAVVDGRASGVVIESSLDRGRGPVATVLVQQGTLRKGDFVVCGVEYGRMRALIDETGKQVAEAGPSIPVQVLGLSGVPETGDDFVAVEDERLAREVAEERQLKRRETRMVSKSNRLEDIIAKMGQGEEQQTLNILVKGDVQGSVEALRESLTQIGNDRVRVNVVASGVGGITESDATLAAASKALVIGFNVRADASARKVIETNGLDVRYFSIIYDVIDQVTQAATGLLGMEVREDIIGTAEVRDVFRSSKFGAVAGCMVTEGVVKRSKPIRVLRDHVVIFEGELESLRRFKDLVDEVRNGMECGIAVKQYNDVKPGDQIECFERTEVARTL